MVESIFLRPDHQKPAPCQLWQVTAALSSQVEMNREVAGAEVLGNLHVEAYVPAWQGL